MSNFSNNTTLKTTWTNALFGVLLIALLSAAARFGTWYGVMWQGDPEIFWTEFAILSVWLLMFSLLLPVICYLIAYGRTVEEIRDLIGVDSLGYLSLEATNKIAVGARCGFCNGCFSGEYPIEVPDTIEKNIFESGIGENA